MQLQLKTSWKQRYVICIFSVDCNAFQRHKLGQNLTPITYESFMKWKQERKTRQAAEADAATKAKAEAYKAFKAGSKTGMAFSGKELFDFNPDWAKGGEDEEGAIDDYTREEYEEEQPEEPSDDQTLPEIETLEIVENDVDDELFDDLEGLEDDE